MSTLLLDPNQTSDIEDARSKNVHEWSMLAPSAVPTAIETKFTVDGKINEIVFVYPAIEDFGDLEVLDELSNPQVSVRSSAYTKKVVELIFSDPIDSENDIVRLAARLRAKAKTVRNISKRLSYVMASSILSNIGKQLLRQ